MLLQTGGAPARYAGVTESTPMSVGQATHLRNATGSQNCMNISKHKGVTSKYKGVYYCKEHRKWRATITVNGKWRHLGWFATEEKAAKAYKYCAEIEFGEFYKKGKL